METNRFKILAYVCIILQKDDHVFLIKRANTGWLDGSWSIPGGGLEDNESLAHATAREAGEELGISVDSAHLQLVHVSHVKTDDRNRIGFYFCATQWHGEPKNNEPSKCSEAGWFALNSLPAPMNPFVHTILQNYVQKNVYSFVSHINQEI
jgi:8-oxo-dGTP diphosphatase